MRVTGRSRPNLSGTRWSRAARLPALATLTLLVATGCGAATQDGAAPSSPTGPATGRAGASLASEGPTQQTLTVGTGLTPETRHAAYIYQAALQQAGYRVEVVDTDPTREALFASMGLDPAVPQATASPQATGQPVPTAGLTHITPDLTGDLLLYLTDNGSKGPNNDTLKVRGLSTSDIYNALGRTLPAGASLLEPSSATSRYGYVMTQATAAHHQISGMEDLREHCKDLALTAPGTYPDNPSGAASLDSDYSCTPRETSTRDDRAEQIQDLITGRTDLAYVFTADPALKTHNLVLLDDPERTQLAQNIVPVVRNGELPQEAIDIINSVSASLTADHLTRLNSLTSGDHPLTETEAAHFWLTTLKG
ncbi:glycine betaine ABC transporter substrate-binding protein [Rothia nasimurium]|uniref:glycine betaine ABC transporter substrate-binding protein n=1 Tax=Rothia nasimurium TaxID=85336 RepID=UPI001F318E45|nr:glycine betaine ABC transporter substrate-binding protein [Rothia nasimurium]